MSVQSSKGRRSGPNNLFRSHPSADHAAWEVASLGIEHQSIPESVSDVHFAVSALFRPPYRTTCPNLRLLWAVQQKPDLLIVPSFPLSTFGPLASPVGEGQRVKGRKQDNLNRSTSLRKPAKPNRPGRSRDR